MIEGGGWPIYPLQINSINYPISKSFGVPRLDRLSTIGKITLINDYDTVQLKFEITLDLASSNFELLRQGDVGGKLGLKLSPQLLILCLEVGIH